MSKCETDGGNEQSRKTILFNRCWATPATDHMNQRMVQHGCGPNLRAPDHASHQSHEPRNEPNVDEKKHDNSHLFNSSDKRGCPTATQHQWHLTQCVCVELRLRTPCWLSTSVYHSTRLSHQLPLFTHFQCKSSITDLNMNPNFFIDLYYGKCVWSDSSTYYTTPFPENCRISLLWLSTSCQEYRIKQSTSSCTRSRTYFWDPFLSGRRWRLVEP